MIPLHRSSLIAMILFALAGALAAVGVALYVSPGAGVLVAGVALAVWTWYCVEPVDDPEPEAESP